MFSGGIERDQTSGMKWVNTISLIYLYNKKQEEFVFSKMVFLTGETGSSEKQRWNAFCQLTTVKHP